MSIANITLVRDNATVVSTPGPYKCKQIYQPLAPAAVFDNCHTVLGLWMIDRDCCGMGIRESFSSITGKLCSFLQLIGKRDEEISPSLLKGLYRLAG